MNLLLVPLLVSLISAALFVFACLAVGRNRFPRGIEIDHPDPQLYGSREERIQNIRDQSDRVHRVFEFYLKVTLAILGGVAYLVSNAKPGNSQATSRLLAAAGSLELLIGVTFSVITFLHLKSKIARWSRSFSWWEPLVWMECWFVAVMMTIAILSPGDRRTGGCSRNPALILRTPVSRKHVEHCS